MFISVFPGCSAGSKSLPKAEQITLVRCVPDPAALEVFVISKDLTVRQYDFTSCWMDNALTTITKLNATGVEVYDLKY